MNAATYNLTSGSYPPCSTNWNVSGTTYTCNGNGRVTLASGDILTSNTTITISANNGFSLSNNTIGSSSNRINLTSTYGTHNASATTTIWGNLTSEAAIILAGTTVNGTVITNANINLTGGSVSGLVRSNNNIITTNGTNLGGGATAQSGMSITGGTLAGNFVMTSNNAMTLSGVTMTSGSISGASTVTIQNGSMLGGGASSIAISSNSGAITVDNSTVYGNLTAPNYSTVNVTNGAAVYGTCLPNSTPANACGPAPVSLPSTPMNCPAGTSSGITGNYYNNLSFTEPATATRLDAPINFSWGGAAPGPAGINADGFSVRWSGYIRVTQTGAYRFQTVSDDGVRLTVGGTQVINNWTNHSATTDTSTDFVLTAGQTYTVVLEYYENGGDATIRLQWRLPGSPTYVAIPGGPTPALGAGLYECTTTAKPPISSCPTNAKLVAGITGNYFNNRTLTAPVTSTRLDGPINFDWGTGVPGITGVGVDNFSVSWNGYIYVSQTGVYRFQTNSDDGVRLTVNGDLLIDQWNDHSATTHTSIAVNLEAGKAYPIKLEFYENGGFAVVQLRWQIPGSASYVPIPIGVNAATITSAGLYQCNSVAGYAITHSNTGITCAGEVIRITALDSSGNVITPVNGTTVTLDTSSTVSEWFDSDTFIFNGAQDYFTKILKQPIPATVNIDAIDNYGVGGTNNPDIVFADAALKFSNIPIQVAGVTDGNPTLIAIKTDPNTGVCVPQLSGDREARIAFTCVNPDECESGQLTLDDLPAGANPAGLPSTYNPATLYFDPSGVAKIPLNYSDVGQVQVHAQVDLPATDNDPAVMLEGSSNPFVVKPYTLKTAAPATNPGTTNSGAGFIPAGEKFNVTVQSFNAAGNLTPNFGNETASERNKIQLQMGCPERDDENDPACASRKPDYPVDAHSGELTIGEDANDDAIIDPPVATSAGGVLPVTWNEVGSFRLEANLSGTGYLGAGDVHKITPGTVIGRFYPDQFELTSPSVGNSCDVFSYMEHPNIQVQFIVNALNTDEDVVQNYDNKDLDFITADIEHVLKDLNAELDTDANISDRFVIENTAEWAQGILTFNYPAATFRRARNLENNNIVVDGPFSNSIQLGIKILSDDPVKQVMDMNADKMEDCSDDCTAHSLDVFDDVRFGRLRIDGTFGPESAALPVNFVTEYWSGSVWAKNTSDSCTAIARNNIFYGPPEVDISTETNLTISLDGGTTTGSYADLNPSADPAVMFTGGDAGHQFSAPGGGTGSFFERINLASYPWLIFDWNQNGEFPEEIDCLPTANDPDCNVRANFGFGSYRGHDRVIYWREILQ